MCAGVQEKEFREFVKKYPLVVPPEELAEEVEVLTMNFKHQLQYEMLAKGCLTEYSPEELEEKLAEICEEAEFSLKSEKILQNTLAKNTFTVSREELEAEAAAIAARQNTSTEMMKKFFGEDLKLLERDLLERKAMEALVAGEI